MRQFRAWLGERERRVLEAERVHKLSGKDARREKGRRRHKELPDQNTSQKGKLLWRFLATTIARRWLAAGVLSLLAAWPAAASRAKILHIGFVPSENLQEMNQAVAPLIRELRISLHMPVVPYVPSDYPGVIEAMQADRLEAAFLPPGAFVLSENEAKKHKRLFMIQPLLRAIRNGHDTYYSAIIVRRDSGLRTLKDLRNKRFAFGDPQSMAGSIFPKALLRAAGILPERDLHLLAPGGHDVTVLAVFNRQADAGAVYANDPQGHSGAWTNFLRTANEQKQLTAIAVSKPIPNDMLCVNARLDAHTVAKLRKTFLGLGLTPAGRELLHRIYNIDGFKPTRSEDYDPVRSAILSGNH